MSEANRKRNTYPIPPPKPPRTFASKRSSLNLTDEDLQRADEYDTLWPSKCEPILQQITCMKLKEQDTSNTGGTCHADDQICDNKKGVQSLGSVKDKISKFENQRSDKTPRTTEAQTASISKSALSSDAGESKTGVKRPIPKPRLTKKKSKEIEKRDTQEDVYAEIDDEKTNTRREYQYVAAIDVGTAYSGYAFSSREHFDRNPIDIISPHWNDGMFLSLKTATCVLYNAQGQLDSFGFEADNKYYEMSMNDPEAIEHWLKFTHFKMKLYDAKGPLEHMVLEADEGGSMPALIVFSDVIRYLKQNIIEHIRQLKSDVFDDDVRWVVTVPAIWNDEARKFMIKASAKAGIHADDLFLCLEPEAAAVMCKELNVQKYIHTKSDEVMAFMLGSKFVVVDLGGGTVDITTNEVLPSGMIRELKCCRGSDCGGTYVNKCFREFMQDIVDKDFEVLNKSFRTEINDLWRSFEVKKRQVDPQKSQYVMLQIPSIVAQKIIPEKLIKYGITLVRDKLKLPMEVFQNFFASSVSSILGCLREVVTDDIHSILLVGGYAGYKEIQWIIRKTYPRQRLVCPPDSDLVVVKGAVIFGHNPAVISSRISKMWYGIHIQPNVTPVDTIYEGNFYPMIKKGQPVKIGEKVQHKFSIHDSFEGDVIIVKHVSFSGDEMPVNVDDTKCMESEHSLRVPVPRYQGDMKRILKINVKFKGTEIEYSSFVTIILCPTKSVVQVT